MENTLQEKLSNLASASRVESVKTPSAVTQAAPSIPVWPLQRDCFSFYGDPRPRNSSERYNLAWAHDNLVHVPCPWPLNMGPGIKVPFITIHRKCANSLTRVLVRVWNELKCDFHEIDRLQYDVFSGSFAPRNKRGASSLSMHAFGAAIDFDAPDNQFHARKHLFTDESPLVIAFRDEGWIWGGDWDGSGVDAMHFQAARVHR